MAVDEAGHGSSGSASRRWTAAWTARLRYCSIRTRLILLVIVIDVFAAALTGSVLILTARSATKLEIAASMRLADVLVADTIRMMGGVPPALVLQTIGLNFESVRHVRIAVSDKEGHPVRVPHATDERRETSERASGAPAWFARSVAPASRAQVFPLLLGNRLEGEVTVAPEPADEIGEAWQYARAILVTGVCLNLAIFGALFVLFGRALKPLDDLVGGLVDLEQRNYAVRLARPGLPELSTIADHFNRLAEALASAYDANHALNRKLLTAQDDERRRTALELHDEVGPCLFALDVGAASLVAAAAELDDGRDVVARATELLALTTTVKTLNRRLLDRLRPMSLGRLPLSECLLRLVVEMEAEGGPSIQPFIGPLADSYGRLVDLTVYRCTQEGLFNAVQHARASTIILTVGEAMAEAPRLELTVRDDGRGMVDAGQGGRGLAGMRERVEALQGLFLLRSSEDGTSLSISLPAGVSAEHGNDRSRDA